jgi:hypothetical protein
MLLYTEVQHEDMADKSRELLNPVNFVGMVLYKP